MSAVVLHVEDGWYAFDNGALSRLPAYPALQAPSLVVTDFPGAICDVMALDDKPAFAAAIIERQLRLEGQVDGECKVLIHQQLHIGEGFQALYTAVPIDLWQRMLSWSRQQADICLIVPLASLLWRKLRNGQGLVLHTGRRLTFCAREQDRLLYANTVVFGDQPADRLDALSTLAVRIKEQRRESSKPLSIGWCVLQTADHEEEARLVAHFAERSGLAVTLQAPGLAAAKTARGREPNLPDLLNTVSVRDAINSVPTRLAFVAERSLPLLTVASLVLSLGLALLGGYWLAQAAQARDKASELALNARQMSEAAATLQGANPLPPETAVVRQLLTRLHGVQSLSDPYGELQLVRDAAGEVRILRVRSGEEAGRRYLRVEGVVGEAGQGDRQLSTFLQQLRLAGYGVTAIDAASNSQPSGFFSYQLDRLGVLP